VAGEEVHCLGSTDDRKMPNIAYNAKKQDHFTKDHHIWSNLGQAKSLVLSPVKLDQHAQGNIRGRLFCPAACQLDCQQTTWGCASEQNSVAVQNEMIMLQIPSSYGSTHCTDTLATKGAHNQGQSFAPMPQIARIQSPIAMRP
jgi:hypothetical protein